MKQTKNFFRNIKTIAQLSVRYKQLSKQHHPDAGGDEETMKEINLQRDKLARSLMRTEGMSDADIDQALQSDEWMESVSQLGMEVIRSGNFTGTVMSQSTSIANDILNGDPSEFTNEKGEVDIGKIMNNVLGRFGIGKKPQGKIDPKKNKGNELGDGK